MPATSAPGGAPSAPTGQEGMFASHLATAANKQGATGQQSASANKAPAAAASKNTASSPEAAAPAEASQTATASTVTETGTGSPPETDSTADQPAASKADSTPVDQALLFFTLAAAMDLNTAPTVIQTLDNQTAVDRMLGAISTNSTANTTPQTGMASPAGQSTVLTAENNQAVAVGDQAQATAAPQSPAMETAPAEAQATVASAPAPSQGATAMMATALFTASSAQTSADDSNAATNTAKTTAQATSATTGQTAATTVTTTSTQATAQAVSLQQNAARQGFSQIGQGEYNQIITVHQESLTQETTNAELTGSTSTATAATANDTVSGTRQDANQSYIQSKLPKETGTTEQAQANNQQQGSLNDQQSNGGTPEPALGQPQTEPMHAQKPQFILNQDGQPLIFANTREAAAPIVTGSTATMPATADTAMLRLPSGIMVPEGTVIEQMITRLSMNQRLETSTVNLKLYPQELGELRMEIKVEQDNIKAHIITQNPQAQEMVDRHIPRLREALEQQGLHLQEVEVTIAANDNGNDHRYQDNSRQQQLNRSMQSTITQPVIRIEPAELNPEPEYNSTSNLSILA